MSYHAKKVSTSDLDYRDDYVDADVGGVTATLTGAQLLNGVLNSDPSGGAITLTLPTAALLVSTDTKSSDGSGFHFFLRNDDGTNAITVAIGTGGTLKGSGTVSANAYSQFYVRFTNVSSGAEAYDLIRLI